VVEGDPDRPAGSIRFESSGCSERTYSCMRETKGSYASAPSSPSVGVSYSWVKSATTSRAPSCQTRWCSGYLSRLSSAQGVPAAVNMTTSSEASTQSACCGRYLANMWPASAGPSVGSTHVVPYLAANDV